MAAAKRINVNSGPAPRGPGWESIALWNQRDKQVAQACDEHVRPALSAVASAVDAARGALAKCRDLAVESMRTFDREAVRVEAAKAEAAKLLAEEARRLPQEQRQAREAAASDQYRALIRGATNSVIAPLKERQIALGSAAAEKVHAVRDASKRAKVDHAFGSELRADADELRRLERKHFGQPIATRWQRTLELTVAALEVDADDKARLLFAALEADAQKLVDEGISRLKLSVHQTAMRTGAATREEQAARLFLKLRDKYGRADGVDAALGYADAIEAELWQQFKRLVGIDPADRELVDSGEFSRRYLGNASKPFKVDDILADWPSRFFMRREPIVLRPWSRGIEQDSVKLAGGASAK